MSNAFVLVPTVESGGSLEAINLDAITYLNQIDNAGTPQVQIHLDVGAADVIRTVDDASLRTLFAGARVGGFRR